MNVSLTRVYLPSVTSGFVTGACLCRLPVGEAAAQLSWIQLMDFWEGLYA